MGQCCEKCVYGNIGIATTRDIECRRNPPVRLGSGDGTWPWVRRSDPGCGEFKALPAPEPKKAKGK